MGEAPPPPPSRATRMLARRTAHSSASRRCKVHAFSEKAVSRHPPGGSRRRPFPQHPGHYARAPRIPSADEPQPTGQGQWRVRVRPKQTLCELTADAPSPTAGPPPRCVPRAMRHRVPSESALRGRRRARRIPTRRPRLRPRLPPLLTPWVRRGPAEHDKCGFQRRGQ